MTTAIRVSISSSVGSGRVLVLKGSDMVFCYFQKKEKVICARFYSYWGAQSSPN